MGGKPSLRSVVLVAAAVAAGSLIIALAIGAVLRWDFPGFGREYSREKDGAAPFEESRTFPAQGIDRVTLDAASEGMEIGYGASDSFAVRLHGNAGPIAAGNAPRLSVKNEGGTLAVRVERQGIVWLRYGMTLSIELPAGFTGSLAATTASGSIEAADGTFQDLALSSSSGAVRAGAMKARKLRMDSSSGSLRLAAADAGETWLSTSSGSIEAEGLAGAVLASSISGRITLDFRVSPLSVEVRNTSGSVRIGLPEDARFSLDAKSTSGSVECAFPLTITGSAAGGHSLAGTVNGGTQPVKLRTVSGGIQIRR